MLYIIERIAREAKEAKEAKDQIQHKPSQSNCRKRVVSRIRPVLYLFTFVFSSLSWAQSTGLPSLNSVVADALPAALAAENITDGFVPLPVTLRSDDYTRYDDTQVDSWFSQGDQLQEAGLHEEAVKSFDRAWQASRVSDGLYNVAQSYLNASSSTDIWYLVAP